MIVHWLIYLVGGLIAGGINAVAGGGSLLLFPLLVGLGLPAITANTTMSMIVQPGTMVAAFEYRKHLRKLSLHYYFLLLPCLVGSLIGAIALVRMPNKSFEHIAPIFMIMAVILLALQPLIHKSLYKGKTLKKHHLALIILVALSFLIISIYGGYFGAGFGIIVLGLLGLTPLKDIQQMNGLKNLAGLAIGIVDCSYFIAHHLIDWRILPLFMIGTLVGGYYSAKYGSRLPETKLRIVIIISAALVTTYLTYKFYT